MLVLTNPNGQTMQVSQDHMEHHWLWACICYSLTVAYDLCAYFDGIPLSNALGTCVSFQSSYLSSQSSIPKAHGRTSKNRYEHM